MKLSHIWKLAVGFKVASVIMGDYREEKHAFKKISITVHILLHSILVLGAQQCG